LFNLLGIRFARDGKKTFAWNTTVKTLGVQFDLRPSEQKGVVLPGHTESRVDELKTILNSFLDSGVMTTKDAERLRGRLHWFESFAGGRLAQQALGKISSLASYGRTQKALNGADQGHRIFERPIFVGTSNVYTINKPQNLAYFSDGACEGEQNKEGTVGAILENPEGELVQYFSEKRYQHG
jgi:hypothetical protein